METTVVPSIAHLAAATAEDALSVPGLSPPASSTSLNVTPSHRYTLTPQHSNTGESPALPGAQNRPWVDVKTAGSSPGLGKLEVSYLSRFLVRVCYIAKKTKVDNFRNLSCNYI